MYSIKKGLPQTDRIYEEIIYLVNNDDSKFTNSSTSEFNEHQIPILRQNALDYIEQAFKVSDNQHIEVSKDVATKKFSNNTETFNENAIEMKAFSDNPYNLSPGASMVGNIVGHASLVRTLLKHELHRLNVPNLQWTKFELLPKVLISIHAEYYKINEINACFAKWNAYSDINISHSISFDAFNKLLDILVEENENDEKDKKNGKGKFKKAFQKINPFKKKKKTDATDGIVGDQLNTNDVEIEKLFCESKRILLNSFLQFMKNIHDSDADTGQKQGEFVEAQNGIKVNSFNKMLQIINRLERIYLTDGVSKVLSNKIEFYKLMIKNFEIGIVEHLDKNINKDLLNQFDVNEQKLSELIRVVKLAIEHREKFVACFDQNFDSFSDISISKRMYEIYDIQFTALIKPIVLEICKSKCCNDSDDDFIQKEEAVIKKLFELYRELEMFVNYGKQHFVDNKFGTSQFYSWFAPGVDKFFKFFAFHAKTRIIKSIESDLLKPDSDTGKMSSSVIDTMQTIFSIKRNWDVLIGLTKTKEANMLKRIVEQFCSFSKIYLETFLDKSRKSLESKNLESLQVPTELSILVANFNYFVVNFKELIDELTKDKAIDQNIINKQIDNTQLNLKIMIHKFIDFAIQKLSPMIKEAIYEDIDENQTTLGRSLFNRIEQMLMIFLDEFKEREFKKSRLILWQNVVKALEQSAQNGLKTKMSSKFFTNLQKVFEDSKAAFKYNSDTNFIEDIQTTRKVKNLDRLLQRNRFSISELICQYYASRHESQQKFKDDGVNLYGNLTVKCFIYQNVLTIEIKKPENLAPIDDDGIRNPYVKILMIPKDKFPNPRKIKWQNKNNGNIMSSRRNITLKKDVNINESYIHFKVKDEESLLLMFRSFCASLNCFECRSPEERNSRFLGEAFISFKDIPEVNQGNDTQDIELTLTKLQSCDLEPLKAINQSAKAGNKQAIKFLKSLENNSHIKLKFEDDPNNENVHS
ncbi:unnamed protein product [Chironomus riparius]|uniref:Uncharacterized protein n=1 Tax=Chironomus riparius TaxID=315576 RepID=A0A9N9SBF6_9DIPT|nr:unnamed protein product [Chironomus riparius]